MACLGLYSRQDAVRRRRELNKYLDSYTGNVDSATKDTMIQFPPAHGALPAGERRYHLDQ